MKSLAYLNVPLIAHVFQKYSQITDSLITMFQIKLDNASMRHCSWNP
jgi:hypothetical protein